MVTTGKLKEEILFLTFNQDQGCFACGTENGFKIYNSSPYSEAFNRELGGGIAIIEMLYRCNILGIVGGGKNPKYPLNKVMLWDDHQTKCIGEMSFQSEIKSLKLRPHRLVVVLETKVFLYNFSDLKLIDTYETCKNEKGLISLNTDSEKTILACLDKEEGKVNIHFVETSEPTRIEADKNALSAIELNASASIIATSSEKGKVIKIFNTKSGTLLQELRRGISSAQIYSISFDCKDNWLACSSDSKTIHIFALKNQEIAKSKKYLFTGEEKSFSQLKISDSKAKVAFGPENNSIIVISTEGSYYLAKFNPNVAGDCEKILTKNLFSDQS